MGYLLAAFLLFLAESLLKRYILRHREALPRPILGGRVLLRFYPNRGFAFSCLGNRPKLVRWVVSLTVVAFLWVTLPALLAAAPPVPPLAGVGLALVYAGAFSNLLDRWRLGYVVDYFSFPRARRRTLASLVFNLADLCIFSGGLLYVIVFFCRS